MGTPKIKVYQLPIGYTEDGDNDIQSIADDELLPIVDKPLTPEDFYDLTGVNFKENEPLVPIDLSGPVTSNLVPPSGTTQTPETADTNILIYPNSPYLAVIYNAASGVIAPSGYVLSPSGVTFLSAPPSGAYMVYWKRGSDTTTDFIGTCGPWYNGGNKMFVPRIFTASGVLIATDQYSITSPSGLVVFSSPASGILASYTYEIDITKYYIGERENWVDNHMYMRPDVFKGTFDYPGDDAEDPQGNPIIQGPIPQYVNPSGYQIDYRKGLVTFVAEFDSSAYPVHASYAYLVNVRNVTDQTLDLVVSDPSGVGYQYRAVTDQYFPNSIGAAWINRDDSYTPRNIYVGGTLKPQIVTITPYDTLTIKNS